MAVVFPAPLNLYLPLTGGTLTGGLTGTTLVMSGAGTFNGNVTVGPVPASTGNIVLGASATFPNIAFQNGATVRNQLIFDASGGVMLWDFPSGSLRFRDALGGGNTLTIFDAATQNWNYRSGVTLSWNSALFLGRRADANLMFGAADAATAVPQTLSVQGVVAGTADTAGQPWTFNGSISTGAGAPGDIVFQTAGKGAASTVQNTLITALTIKGGTTNNTNVGYPSIVIGNAALATTATDGFLYIPTCAGTPTGVPTAFTGRIAMVYDTTAHQFWFYDAGWKQPKTPGAAAIITWQ